MFILTYNKRNAKKKDNTYLHVKLAIKKKILDVDETGRKQAPVSTGNRNRDGFSVRERGNMARWNPSFLKQTKKTN